MMPFNCSFRNKNEPTAIYPSLGYSPPGKKISKCDDAPAMTLVVQWWLFLPFDTRGRVIFLCRVTFHSAHFTNDRTGITFPSCYNTVGHARVYIKRGIWHSRLSLRQISKKKSQIE